MRSVAARDGGLVKVSIVMPTAGGREGLLPSVLERYLRALPRGGEIVVVEDGADRATSSVQRRMSVQDERIRYVPGEHTGTAGARNRGIEAAEGDLLVFSDDDLLVSSDSFVAEHVQAQAAAPGVWVSYMRVPDSVVTTPFQQYWQRRLHSGTDGLHQGADLGLGGFWFATASIPRSLLGDARFSEAFRAYGWEEHELGLRLHRRGVRPRFLRSALVEHHDRVSFSRTVHKFYEMGRMAWVFARLQPSLRVAMWTGTHPLSRLGRALLRQRQRAAGLPRTDGAALTDARFRLCLEAAYAEGLADGREIAGGDA